MEENIYKSALHRIKYKQMGVSEAVDSASKEFLRDYKIPASETYMIPVDVNGKRTNGILLEQKLEATLLHIETTDYIDKVMGEDGYMHFAKFAGIENLTEEQVRDRVLSTIKNNSVVLNNRDMTGAIVYAEFANGTYPIVNAKGEKIEIFFTDTENNKGIMSTELKYPVTGEDIILVEDSDGLDYLNIDLPSDENQNIGEESITVGSAVDTVGSLFVSKAEAAEMPIMTNEDIVNNWGTFYQTTNDPKKNKRALKVLNKDYTVPEEAKKSIATAAKVFEGDKGLSQTQLIQYGNAIGQIESEYKTKIQKGGGPARSHWQVEPETALDLLNNSSAIFGTKFESALSKYKVNNMSAVKYLASLSEEQMSLLLETDSDLAAIMALGVIVNRIK